MKCLRKINIYGRIVRERIVLPPYLNVLYSCFRVLISVGCFHLPWQAKLVSCGHIYNVKQGHNRVLFLEL